MTPSWTQGGLSGCALCMASRCNPCVAVAVYFQVTATTALPTSPCSAPGSVETELRDRAGHPPEDVPILLAFKSLQGTPHGLA